MGAPLFHFVPYVKILQYEDKVFKLNVPDRTADKVTKDQTTDKVNDQTDKVKNKINDGLIIHYR